MKTGLHEERIEGGKKSGFLEKLSEGSIESTDFSIIKQLLAFHRCRKHHNFLIGGRGLFHHLVGLFFDFFAWTLKFRTRANPFAIDCNASLWRHAGHIENIITEPPVLIENSTPLSLLLPWRIYMHGRDKRGAGQMATRSTVTLERTRHT